MGAHDSSVAQIQSPMLRRGTTASVVQCSVTGVTAIFSSLGHSYYTPDYLGCRVGLTVELWTIPACLCRRRSQCCRQVGDRRLLLESSSSAEGASCQRLAATAQRPPVATPQPPRPWQQVSHQPQRVCGRLTAACQHGSAPVCQTQAGLCLPGACGCGQQLAGVSPATSGLCRNSGSATPRRPENPGQKQLAASALRHQQPWHRLQPGLQEGRCQLLRPHQQSGPGQHDSRQSLPSSREGPLQLCRGAAQVVHFL